MTRLDTRPLAVGRATPRVDGKEKVRGEARYAYEYDVDGVAYGWVVQSSVPRGRVRAVDSSAALAQTGVSAVLWHGNAPRLQPGDDGELAVLQSDQVSYEGQVVALVVADDPDTAREAAGLVRVDVEKEPAKTRFDPDDPQLYAPETANAGIDTDSIVGDVEQALSEADVVVDRTYRTPAYHNNPMEPHAAIASWERTPDGPALKVYDSNQGSSTVAEALGALFDLPLERVTVTAPYVGGGFGSKGTPRPIVVLAALGALAAGRPVKLAATRQQMFAMTGYRTPTVQRVRLGAGVDGRITAVSHDVAEQTSRLREFVEQTASPTRVMYRGEHRRTTHRVVRLDVPSPSWMRAPGETPGMFALESAMDELAEACGVDPVELRILNDPAEDPESGLPFSSRNLVACLNEGRRRFGWEPRRWDAGIGGSRGRDSRHREPGSLEGAPNHGNWLVGTGVAASTYPARSRASKASAAVDGDGRFTVRVAAADIGTGSRTALGQIAADALGVDPGLVRTELGSSDLPAAPLAGGSMGTSSWGWAVDKACRELSRRLLESEGRIPPGGIEVEVDTSEDIESKRQLSSHAFGAQFAEVRVDVDTGEVRVPRLLGIFAAGRIVNPTTARSQFIGGMTMGVSMALMERGIFDDAYGESVNKDLADYHVATYADVGSIEADWIDEPDSEVNAIGTKGIGEIGIVGTAAAIANAVYDATGIRVRELPVGVESLVEKL